MEIKERIVKLREQMKEKGIDIYIVPTADFHQTEYVGEYFKARKFITGFSGSAGTAVITKTEARLWVDGRYFIQAAKQIEGTTVEMMKMNQPGVPTIDEYLEETLGEGETLGFDGRVVSMGDGLRYKAIVERKNGKIIYDYDLIDAIWEDRPPLSREPAFILEQKYAGETTASKLARIREYMRNCGANVHVLTTIDDICWTLNIRGNDIEFFPLVLSYAIITMDRMHLYIDETKLSDEMKEVLAADDVVLHPYNDIYDECMAKRRKEHFSQCKNCRKNDQPQHTDFFTAPGNIQGCKEQIRNTQDTDSDTRLAEQAHISLRSCGKLCPQHCGQRSEYYTEEGVCRVKPCSRHFVACHHPVHVLGPVIVNRQICQVPEDPEDDRESGHQEDRTHTLLLYQCQRLVLHVLFLFLPLFLHLKLFSCLFKLERFLSYVSHEAPSPGEPDRSQKHGQCRQLKAWRKSQHAVMCKYVFVKNSYCKCSDKCSGVYQRITDRKRPVDLIFICHDTSDHSPVLKQT